VGILRPVGKNLRLSAAVKEWAVNKE